MHNLGCINKTEYDKLLKTISYLWISSPLTCRGSCDGLEAIRASSASSSQDCAQGTEVSVCLASKLQCKAGASTAAGLDMKPLDLPALFSLVLVIYIT